MPIKTGTKQLKLQPGAAIGKSREGKGDSQLRRMRCMKCGGQAVSAADGKGSTTLRCPNCKTSFNFQKL